MMNLQLHLHQSHAQNLSNDSQGWTKPIGGSRRLEVSFVDHVSLYNINQEYYKDLDL